MGWPTREMALRMMDKERGTPPCGGSIGHKAESAEIERLLRAAEARGNDNLPPSEWSPTIGQPEAANSDEPKWDREVVVPIPEGATITRWPLVGHDPRYTTLRTVLDAAFAHAATGKGKERHARDLPFDEQPMLETTRLVGPGFPLGQAIKKAGEAAGMIERGELSAAEAECLGAINYLAGAVAWMRERAKETSKKIAEAA